MRVSEIARNYSSFWNDTIPFCDVFVADINRSLCINFELPLESQIPTGSHALVNEFGFDLFHAAISANCNVSSIAESTSELIRISNSTRKRLGRFVSELPAECSDLEIQEAAELATRLQAFFRRHKEVTLRLRLAGCGRLPECEADALAGHTLYEIKAGNRHFRGSDIRQLLLYCAINSESQQYEIQNVCLMNPRRGRYYEVDVDELCTRIAGRGRFDVMNNIVNLLSDAGTSR